jgi:hypothetical protein
MVAVPGATPCTAPAVPTVATNELVENQSPPNVVLVNGVIALTHTALAPPIAGGVLLVNLRPGEFALVLVKLQPKRLRKNIVEGTVVE